MTFTDAELDALQKRLENPPFGMETSERLLIEKAAAAITYLRRCDAIGAVAMHRACAQIAGLWGSEDDSQYVQGRLDAVEAIRTLPLPTHAEILAHARELPEIKALVQAARPYAAIMQDADYGRQMREFDALIAALASLEAAK